MMELKARLKDRIRLNDVAEIISLVQNDLNLREELYELLYDKDERVSYQTAWVLSHFSKAENKWLSEKQNELMDETMRCTHSGKRRVLLQIIGKQSISPSIRVNFLDFCLERMVSKDEPIAVQSCCMKLAYELCRQTPELLAELTSVLELMEPALLTPATRSVRKNVFLKISTFGK